MAIIDKETVAEQMIREIGPGLTRAQRSRLQLAHTLAVETARHKPSKRERREAEAIIAAVRREMNAGVEETVKLERARGGHVSQPQHGPVTATDRDGLHSLYVACTLDRMELAIGMAYRHAYEHDRGRLGSCLREDAGGSAVFRDEAAFEHAMRSGLSSRIDRDVALELKHRPSALHMLRSVAGEGRSVTSLAAGAHQRALYVASLKVALEVAGRRIATY